MLNVVTPSSLLTVNAYPALGLVNVTFWFVLNGWLGNLILWRGVDTTFFTSPNVEKAVEPNPTTVPTPIDSCGLKNILSFNLELNSVTANPVLSKLNVFGIKLMWVPTVWTPETAPLFTLNMLFVSKVFKTSNFSVPIPMLLPTEINDGIFETYMSVTTPVVTEFGISWYTNVLAVDIETLKESLSPDAELVLNPLMETRSPLFIGGDVDINADISWPLSLTKTTFS